MKTISAQQPINLKVVRFEFDFTTVEPKESQLKPEKNPKKFKLPQVNFERKHNAIPPPPTVKNSSEKKRDTKQLVEDLLDDLYAEQREWGAINSADYSRGSTSAPSVASSLSVCDEHRELIRRTYFEDLDVHELCEYRTELEEKLRWTGERLAKRVRCRDRFRREQRKLCAAFSVLLRQLTGDNSTRFGVTPGNEGPGEGGFTEWLHAMRLVARLPAGVPQHFRRKLWLTLSERYLTSREIEWSEAERDCFRGTALPDDAELGAQILKDLHRTGCSLFCGSEGRENQAMLRRVLLAYARWNKEVGYCQGFNMLAAIILEVMDKSESDSLKVMIYLVEAVLPEGYFADDLRGLSADMAAFRDLLRLRLPRLATHMDHLQKISDGGGIEPPLPDVFTMQWFLTLYATWLPRESLLRIWDLILLDGNEILLLTALAIWDILQDRILSARSADEFYSCMGGGSSAIYEAGEALVAKVVSLGSAPELPRLRNIHRYKVTPPVAPQMYQPPLHSAMQSMTKRGLRLFYSEDEGESSDDGNKLALATVCPRREERSGTGDRLSLDIGALKRQYARLRERQRQAHVILAAACARHAAVGVPTSPTSLTVNNLLLGKSAIVSSRGRRLGPPPGAVPPTRQTSPFKADSKREGHTSETISWNDENKRKSLSRRNSLKWKDIKKDENKPDRIRKASIDLDESGDGVIVSDSEASAMVASVRIRTCSESSSYSSHSSTSSDTSLCDENDNVSDAEHDLNDRVKKVSFSNKPLPVPELKENNTLTPLCESILHTPDTKEDTKKSISNIDDYLDSVAGEPLRTYIDGFEDKCNDEIDICTEINLGNDSNNLQNIVKKDKNKQSSPFSKIIISQTSNIVKSLNFTELSPLSPPHCSFASRDSHHSYQNRYSQCFRPVTMTRPPDVIDSLTKYPNFVPDIDLTDKISTEYDSLSHSPDNESVIVSEDEPPIPLKIDKYFEHSPEFFGARITDPNSIDIPSRRTARRDCRTPKKPDFLTLKTSHNENVSLSVSERASSLPQSHSFKSIQVHSPYIDIRPKNAEFESIDRSVEHAIQHKQSEMNESFKTPPKTYSPKGYITHTGRKNSEKALQIIQENSKILNRILTKQTNNISVEDQAMDKNILFPINDDTKLTTDLDSVKKYTESSILKESMSDSVIRYRKKETRDVFSNTTDMTRIRPISIDDPSSLDARLINKNLTWENFPKPPSNGSVVNKTDLCGWENKGFLAKYNFKAESDKSETKYESDYKTKCDSPLTDSQDSKQNVISNLNRHSYSGDLRPSRTTNSTEPLTSSYERKIISDDSSFLLSKKYNDLVLSKASDICRQMVTQEPTSCETLKTDKSQVSDFANIVTSSISFTYEPSQDDDSPTGAKSNSSDTLCQITSLDQVSTPISPKIFSNKEATLQTKDSFDKSEKTKVESESTCSAITSLLETDTFSSFSYPRSPSTGSYHPFPTRQSMRVKELGIKLGMYPKDSVNSSPK